MPFLRFRDRRSERYDSLTEKVARRVLSRGATTVDIGAHTGAILRRLVKVAPLGRHYAIEPLPQLAERLRATFPSVTVLEVALAERDGTLPFRHVLAEPAYSGFDRRPWDTYAENVEMIEVQVRRLDDVLEGVPVDFIKVDVENAELRVFQGAPETLSKRPFVSFEVGDKFLDVYDLLTETGLSVSRLQDWLAGRPQLSRDDFAAARKNDFFFLAHP